MIIKTINKTEVMSKLGSDGLYLVKTNKYYPQDLRCSISLVSSLSVRDVLSAINNTNTAFIQIIKEES